MAELIEAEQSYTCLVVFEGHEKPPVLLGTAQPCERGHGNSFLFWFFMSHCEHSFGDVSRLCLFLCPSRASIQVSFLMGFRGVWGFFFVMKVTLDQIKYGPVSPEVQVTSVRQTNGSLLRLHFELVPQMCNSRNPVKRPQLGHCSHS